MSEAVNAGKKPWIAHLDKEASYWGEGMWESVLAIMMKDFLLSDSDSTAADTARRIDNYYEQEFLPSDPLMKFLDDKGIGGFLTTFYELVFNLARLIPYNSSNQEKLVQLILELRKLPPRQFKIWKEDCLVWTREPLFILLTEDNWNGSYPSDAKERRSGNGEQSFQELCDEWVKLSSFFARCIEAGLYDNYQNRCKHASIDIPQGLGQDLPRGVNGDCKVMVAAQYILLAGRTLADDCFNKPVKGFGPEEWKCWAEKFKEISMQEDGNNTDMVLATEEARKYMVSLHPEIIQASEDN